MTTTLFLLRHAHTEANELGATPRMAGWAEIPLSARGESQLDYLRTAGFDGVDPIVYTSRSSRALRTALAAAQGRTVVTTRALREISCGDVEGWHVNDVVARFPDLWERNLAQEDPHFRWPGGESYLDFRRRVLHAIRGIATRHAGKRVLVVTHAGFIAQALGHVHGLSPACWEKFRPRNSTVTTIECNGDGDPRNVVAFEEDADELTLAAGARRAGE